jgi:endonuclease YncB( thermonuclease family)
MSDNNQLTKNLLNELSENATSAKSYIFENLIITGLCVKVIDGDTIKCVIKYKDEYLKLTVRLDGIDTAEKNSKNEAERKLSEKATNFTKILLNNRLVDLIFLKTDKYGRHLCNVYQHGCKTVNGGSSLSSQLINAKLANVYSGGKKENFENFDIK